jgi:hypothetical protein
VVVAFTRRLGIAARPHLAFSETLAKCTASTHLPWWYNVRAFNLTKPSNHDSGEETFAPDRVASRRKPPMDLKIKILGRKLAVDPSGLKFCTLETTPMGRARAKRIPTQRGYNLETP